MINNKKLKKILKRFPREAMTNVKTVNASQDENGIWKLEIIVEKIENDNENFLAKAE